MLSELLRHPKGLLVRLCAGAASLWLALAPLCPAAAQQPLSAGLTGLAVEQVCARMPRVEVYVRADGPLPADAEAYLDGEKLTYTGAQGRADFSTSYIVMLDASGSIRAGHLAAAKEQIVALAERLRPGDSVTLITFGEEVELAAAGCTDPETLAGLLAEQPGRDQYTRLYAAITEGLDYAAAAGGQDRQVMLIVSDGLEENGSVGITREEIERALAQANMPVYALCVDHAPVSAQEEFGQFARSTGGAFVTFGPEDAAEVWQGLLSGLDEAARLCFEADSNRVDGKTHTLLLKVDAGRGQESYTGRVTLSAWAPDTTPPTVTACVYDEAENALRVTFSEEVTGADVPEHYVLTGEGAALAPAAVSALEGNSYSLALPDDLPAGEYQLAFVNIRDASMEENPLEAEPFPFQKARGWRELAPVLAAAAILMAAAALALRQARRKPAPEPPAPQQVVYRVQHVTAGPDIVRAAGPGARKARLTVETMSGPETGRTFEVAVDNSSIWGRDAAMCDVCLENDPYAARQHCALTVEADGVWLHDLGSKNGTYLNGIRIASAQKLRPGDLLRAGYSQFRILAAAAEQPDVTHS